jgi:arginyl-tRNA--protein-N-Asp/Glu arginylyltransferase
MFLIEDYFNSQKVSAKQLDYLLANGWRHNATDFYRFSTTLLNGEVVEIMPLRIALKNFSLSRSQKRVLSRNRDLRIVIRKASISRAKEMMFQRHKQRFKDNVPDSIYDFLTTRASSIPCRKKEICAYLGKRLIAANFLGIGRTSTDAVYTIFEPEESKRSLGTLLILEGIRYSQQLKYQYYYPGYAYHTPSVLDYKKRFAGVEYYDWADENWKPV